MNEYTVPNSLVQPVKDLLSSGLLKKKSVNDMARQCTLHIQPQQTTKAFLENFEPINVVYLPYK